MGLVLGLALAFILGTGLHFGAKIFTQDANVHHLIQIGIPVIVHFQIGKDIGVVSSQPPKQGDLHSYIHVHSFLPVCCSHSTPEFFSICFLWYQLWGIWFCIFSLLHGEYFLPFFNVTWYYDKWHIQPSALNIKDYFIMVTLRLWLQFLASFVCLFCHPLVVSLEFGLLWPSIWVLGHLLAS